ncbi:uncharacterized protein A1O5_01595 [Cladophialophora psammophila CBS 110553]|uniref:Metallo-beta-lactamase domain-containing protein n=1 Tax=Cladophialophora psammophila CBS 110553 TaxID=1182543 RepID=W9XXB6_9EURO|nr:uncharacterized protein A1O5_01595 [Cladophialophora psammophila CBS 110553]EXJ74899.1 hypothetical protein A1O5_01595 [Cladophialophora psammophila CBS 110553]
MAPQPDFQIPGGSAASVKIIDTTSLISKVNFVHTLGPAIEGVPYVPDCPVWSFLIENAEGRKVLFDLGTRKDWKNLAPIVSNRLVKMGWEVTVEKNITQILEENGFSLVSFEAVIWSHYHWDHIGNPALFPKNVALVVGSGFNDEFMPGYPAREDSILLESDYEGRKLIEIDFQGSRSLKIGQMNACDFFGDGSFYLLDAPGHTVAHICGLVRTTSTPDTFILMGADSVHDGGELRPSRFLPIPESMNLRQFLPASIQNAICPGHILEDIQRSRGRQANEPFFTGNIAYDIPALMQTIEKLQHADAQKDVFFIYAHDRTIMDVVDFFPKQVNDWKSKGWAELVKWAFLKEYWQGLRLDKLNAS